MRLSAGCDDKKEMGTDLQVRPHLRSWAMVGGIPTRPGVTNDDVATTFSCVPLNQPCGARLEQGVCGVGKGAGEIAVHRNHAALLKLGTHDDEVRAAEAFAEPMWCGPGKRPADPHAVAADLVDESGDMPGRDEAAALSARPGNQVGQL